MTHRGDTESINGCREAPRNGAAGAAPTCDPAQGVLGVLQSDMWPYRPQA